LQFQFSDTQLHPILIRGFHHVIKEHLEEDVEQEMHTVGFG